MTPTQMGAAKLRMELTPRISSMTITTRVVNVVFKLRAMVCQMLLSTISAKGALLNWTFFLFSRIRSKTTIVALME